MFQENIAVVLAIAVLISFGFMLGRLSLALRNSSLKKENRVMRNLLYRLSAMENLNSQLFYSIVQEFIRKEEPKDPSLRERK